MINKEEIAKIIARWHGEDKPCQVCLKIASEINTLLSKEEGAIMAFLVEENARIDYEDKWLVWYEDMWQVLQRPYGAKKNRCLYSGQDIMTAISALKESKGE